MGRLQHACRLVVLAMLGVVASASWTVAQVCGDADASGTITVSDGVQLLRAAAGLTSACTAATCDVDGNGVLSVTDGIAVLRTAAGLGAPGPCGTFPALALTRVASGLDRPLFVTAAPGDDARLFVVEQGGRILVLEGGTILAPAFLDISGLTTGTGEQGLLGLAFDPAYATTGRFYLNYTDLAGDTVIAEYERAGDDPRRASPQASRILLAVEQPFANHNGGMVAFGPDGFLYIGLGDGGGGGDPQGNAQRVSTKLGKILRIDPANHPTPPPGNLPGGDPDVWDYGLRNPFRFSFDRATGALYIGDVGQNAFEEIDVEPAGSGRRNYGWNVTEGFDCFRPSAGCDTTGITFPAVAYENPEVGCSVIGGYVYRGGAIPALAGRYFYGDLCSRRISTFVWDGGAATDQRELSADLDSQATLGSIASFGQDDAGELYVVDLGGGAVYRIDPE